MCDEGCRPAGAGAVECFGPRRGSSGRDVDRVVRYALRLPKLRATAGLRALVHEYLSHVTMNGCFMKYTQKQRQPQLDFQGRFSD